MSQGFLPLPPEDLLILTCSSLNPILLYSTAKVNKMRSVAYSSWEEYSLDGEGGGGWGRAVPVGNMDPSLEYKAWPLLQQTSCTFLLLWSLGMRESWAKNDLCREIWGQRAGVSLP